MKSIITESNPSVFNTPQQKHDCSATQESSRSTEVHKLELRELLFHVVVRVAAVALMFGLAGCMAPTVSQTRGCLRFRVVNSADTQHGFTAFATAPSHGLRS